MPAKVFPAGSPPTVVTHEPLDVVAHEPSRSNALLGSLTSRQMENCSLHAPHTPSALAPAMRRRLRPSAQLLEAQMAERAAERLPLDPTGGADALTFADARAFRAAAETAVSADVLVDAIEDAKAVLRGAVSYTHLTLPTICSV